MGNMQCTHMGSGLDVPGPHVTLGPGSPKAIWAIYSTHIWEVGWMSQDLRHTWDPEPPTLKVSPLPFQFGLMQKQETKRGGLRTAVASGYICVRFWALFAWCVYDRWVISLRG